MRKGAIVGLACLLAPWALRAQQGDAAVAIPDDALRCVITEALGKATDAAVTQDEMATLAELASTCEGAVEELTGLEHASGLQILELPGNSISDLGALSELVNLQLLDLADNLIDDIEPLTGLTALGTLNLSDNAIEDIEPLAGLTGLTWLNLAGNAIKDVGPLTGLTALGSLRLSDNAIMDVGPLTGLTALEDLNLSDNAIEDIEPLAGLTGLTWLRLSDNAVTDIEPFKGLTGLRWLDLSDNAIEDIEPLGGLTALGGLNLSGNAIGDIEALASLTALGWLNLSKNAISDIEPLRPLASLGELNLKGNPLTAASIATHLQGFREAGATVRWNWEYGDRQVAWFVPSAADPARQGFVRVINRSAEGGEVSIVAIDDLGRRYGPLTLTVRGNETVHFNSNDLETGNPGKGLPDGTGPGDGGDADRAGTRFPDCQRRGTGVRRRRADRRARRRPRQMAAACRRRRGHWCHAFADESHGSPDEPVHSAGPRWLVTAKGVAEIGIREFEILPPCLLVNVARLDRNRSYKQAFQRRLTEKTTAKSTWPAFARAAQAPRQLRGGAPSMGS